jgi:hypothetical protein
VAEQIQTVTLFLSDGRRLYFTGRFQADPAIFDTLRVTDVLLSEPMELPSNCRIETLKDIKEAGHGTNTSGSVGSK